jgi:hypothetical protein
MKKILYVIGALFVMLMGVTFTSCEQCSGPTANGVTIQYQLNADAQADGQFDVTFPRGKFTSNGEAKITFEISSMEPNTQLMTSQRELVKALESNDEQEKDAAMEVSSELDKINISSLDGHYLVHIKGYAKEPTTGLIFVIDRTYTNIDSLKTNH